MVTELITADSGKTKASPKTLKGAMKVIKKLKGRIGLGEFLFLPLPNFVLFPMRFPVPGQPFVSKEISSLFLFILDQRKNKVGDKFHIIASWPQHKTLWASH